MATRDRLEFIAQAVACFRNQRWPSRELIIVDDGSVSAAPVCAGVPGVRHIRLTELTGSGTKLNLASEAAGGSVIQKLDDDDFYGPDFLAWSEAHLPHDPQENAVVAWCCFIVLFRGDLRLRHSGHGWTTGGSFCFHRELWRRQPFRDVPNREDAWYLSDYRPRIERVCAPEQYIVVRHGTNTWRNMEGGDVDTYLRSCASFCRPVESIVGPDHAPFYAALMHTPRP